MDKYHNLVFIRYLDKQIRRYQQAILQLKIERKLGNEHTTDISINTLEAARDYAKEVVDKLKREKSNG